jgi:hypothetical protein
MAVTYPSKLNEVGKDNGVDVISCVVLKDDIITQKIGSIEIKVIPAKKI